MSLSTRASQVQKLLIQSSPDFSGYRTSQVDLPVQLQLVQSAGELKQGELQVCLKLVEHTSGDDYKASSIGWKPKDKLEEMGDIDMLYLLVRHADGGSRRAATTEDDQHIAAETEKEPTATCISGTILGFMSFMFTYDDPPHEDREVIYMYEIHFTEQLRGRGLGTKLVEFLEMSARQTGISKTMLTVFASNSGARRLYEKLGYCKDACSPGNRVTRTRIIKADYVIMSKELV